MAKDKRHYNRAQAKMSHAQFNRMSAGPKQPVYQEVKNPSHHPQKPSISPQDIQQPEKRLQMLQALHQAITISDWAFMSKMALHFDFTALKEHADLTDIVEQIVQLLIRNLESKNENIQRSAIQLIGKIGNQQAILPLVEIFEKGSPSIQLLILEALVQLDNKQARNLYADALRSQDRRVRQVATQALGQIEDARAIEPLLSDLADQYKDVQRAAVAALEKLRNVWSVEPFIQALEDQHENVRQFAAEALGQIGDKQAVEPLLISIVIQYTNFDKQKSRYYESLNIYFKNYGIHDYLSFSTEKQNELHAFESFCEYGISLIVEALRQIGMPAKSPLLRALKAQDRNLRKAAAETLGRIGEKWAVPSLLRALKDQDDVRHEVVKALGRIGDVRAMEPLIHVFRGAYKNEEMDVAAEALGQLGDVRAIEPLIYKLRDEYGVIRSTVAMVLKELIDTRGLIAILPILSRISGKVDIPSYVMKSALDRFNQLDTAAFTAEPLDFSGLTVPMPSLQHILVQAETCDFHQIEYFLTYALNYIGEEYLKRYVIATIYGDPERLNLNVFNALKHLCKQVDILPNETLQW